MESKTLSNQIAKLTIEKKAYDVIILELKNLASFTDYFVICTADSDTQVKAIADFVIDEMKSKDVRVWHYEGYESSNWILLDFVDVVVHIFLKQTREYYNIEKIWGDAKIDYIEDEVIKLPKKRTIKTKKNAKNS